MSKHITVAVIGAGMAGQAHAFGYRNAPMHPALDDVDVELSTIVDVSPELARSVAGRHGFANAATDLEVVLADDSIDAVSVALPNFEYANVIPRLLSAGKHVLAEKPLGRSAAEAYRFATAADAAQRIHSVGFSWRRLGAVEAIAQLVRSGAIGRIWHASAWYLTDYASTEATPLSWRYDREQAGGGDRRCRRARHLRARAHRRSDRARARRRRADADPRATGPVRRRCRPRGGRALR